MNDSSNRVNKYLLFAAGVLLGEIFLYYAFQDSFLMIFPIVCAPWIVFILPPRDKKIKNVPFFLARWFLIFLLTEILNVGVFVFDTLFRYGKEDLEFVMFTWPVLVCAISAVSFLQFSIAFPVVMLGKKTLISEMITVFCLSVLGVLWGPLIGFFLKDNLYHIFYVMPACTVIYAVVTIVTMKKMKREADDILSFE